MHHLSPFLLRNQGAAFEASTSAAYEAFAGERRSVPVKFLSKLVRDGWLRDPNERDSTGRSLLLAYLGTFENPNSGTQAPEPAMVKASNDPMGVVNAVQEHLDMADTLLNRGADPWVRDGDGRDVLDQVISLQWWNVLTRLLSDPRCPAATSLMQRTQAVNYVSTPASGFRPTELPWLHACAALGRTTLMARLLDHGLDVNQRDHQGRTALFYATNVDTVELLLNRGGDALTTDHHGRHAGLHWSTPAQQEGAVGVRARDLVAMHQRLQTAQAARLSEDPRAMQRLHLPVLFEHATNGSKENLVKHMKTNGFTVNERHTVDGREVSLFAEANLGVLRAQRNKRSSASALHLLERLDDPWFESIAGVPDIVLGWLVGCSEKAGQKYLSVVEKHLSERYGWDQPHGFTRFLDDFFPMARTLIAHEQPSTDDNHAHPMAIAVAWAELRAAVNTLPGEAMGWAAQRTPQGHAYAWTWAAIASEGALGPLTPMQASSIQINLEYWATGQTPGKVFTGDPRYTSPVVPFDAMALHAMLAHLGHTNPPGFSHPALYGNYLLDFAFVGALQRGIKVDASLPGFDERLSCIQEERPAVARDLETRVLRLEAHRAAPTTAPRSRSRL